MKRVAALVAFLALFGSAQASHAQFALQERGSPQSQAALTFLQINDVYTALPVDGLGGLARVATLKQQLTALGHPVVMTMSGDFLGPSVASTVFKGEQMVADLNAAGLDFATLGNHEFDFGRDTLVKRMSEARFEWLVANVLDERTGKPIGGAAPYVVRQYGALKVGYIGLCITTSEITDSNRVGMRFIDPLEAAAQYIPMLKREGANVIVAITHLTFATDRALVTRFPEIDLVIGGHEHYPITAAEGHAFISKAGSDAKWAARIDINRNDAGVVERFYELVPVTAAIPDEARTAAVIASYESRLGAELETVVGTTSMPLDATNERLLGESNLGNLVADAMRAGVGADVGLTNGGGLRGSRVYPAGPVSRRMLLTIQPFGNVVCKVAVTGKVLLDALNNGVSKLPLAAGLFPQVSGLTMKVDPRAPVGSRVSNVTVGGAPLDLAKTYTVAVSDYLLKGGDNYTMFGNATVLIAPESGALVVEALERYVAAARDVAPRIEGRITIAR